MPIRRSALALYGSEGQGIASEREDYDVPDGEGRVEPAMDGVDRAAPGPEVGSGEEIGELPRSTPAPIPPTRPERQVAALRAPTTLPITGAALLPLLLGGATLAAAGLVLRRLIGGR
jgi:hypothetical protein